jgi:hypothetical protein
MNDADIVKWLKAGDRVSHAPRLVRARKLVNDWKLYDFEYLLHGGADSAQALHELKLTFLFCCNLSTILLVLIIIEKEIAGLLYLVGLEDAVKMRLESLLQRALQMQCISQKEFDTFNRLRDIRNSYSHFRLPTHSSTTMMRAVERRIIPDDVFEQDAFDATEALVGFLHRDLSDNISK